MGIHNLEILSWALRIRWLWAQRTDPDRPWAGHNINIPPKARAMFNVAMVSVVGDGESTLFWSDRWLDGKTVAELAPSLIKAVSKRAVKGRTVALGLLNRSWVSDITGALTVQLLLEFLLIWDLVDGLVLQPDVPDQHRWKLTKDGYYSSKSAYAAFFEGSTKFGPWRRIWKSWAPLRCKFFMWLALLPCTLRGRWCRSSSRGCFGQVLKV